MAAHGAIDGGVLPSQNARCPILWAHDSSKSGKIDANGTELLETKWVYNDARFFVQIATEIVQASIHEECLTIRK